MPNHKKPAEKTNLHPRSRHRNGYPFRELIKTHSELAEFVFVNPYENETIDFSNPGAVKALNTALLMHDYGLTWWDIPEGCLCPSIPGRADYIHTAADLLASVNSGEIPTGEKINVLDIGVGANCVYPIIGRHEYAWRFVGSDIKLLFLESAGKIIAANVLLKDAVELRLQKDSRFIFRGVVKPDDFFDLTVCNPPFHASAEDAAEGTARKIKNLTGRKKASNVLNFGGGNSELWCDGGEKAFVNRMIKESAEFGKQCRWFTTLVSKKDNLPGVYHSLKNKKALDVRTFELSQGQKTSRVVAWTFFSK